MIPKSHEKECRTAGWAEIARLPWIRPRSVCPLLTQVSAAFARRGLTLEHTVPASDDVTKNAMVRQGIAATVLERSEAVQLEQEGRVFLWQGHDGLSCPLYLACPASRADLPEVTALAGVIRELWPGEGLELLGGKDDD